MIAFPRDEGAGVELIDHPEDPRLDDYRNLRRPKPGGSGGGQGDQQVREAKLGHVVIEGHVALERALAGPLELRSMLLTPSRARTLTSLTASVGSNVPLYVGDRGLLEAVTGFDVHRGVLASANRPAPIGAATMLKGLRRVVILEALTDLENLGAVFRVAAALGLQGVLLDERCPDPLYRRCIRVSMGWSTVIPHARIGSLPGGLSLLDEFGLRTVALTPRSEATSVDRAASQHILDDPIALIVGSEGPGLTEATLAAVGHSVRIPMAGGVDSLNAATALAVVGSFAAAARGWT